MAAENNSPVTITIDPAKILGPVNSLIFGQGVEAADIDGIFVEFGAARKPWMEDKIRTGGGLWNPLTRSVFPEVADRARNIGMSMLRYPGGCLAHTWDWKRAVGPAAERGQWQFGIDEYIAACRKMNLEPVITLPEYCLPLDKLPQTCAELVEYLNAPAVPEWPWAMKRKQWGNPEPYNVKWFELGNESFHGNHNIRPYIAYSAEDYAAYAIATSEAIRKVDPSVKLGIVMVPSGGEDVRCDWNTTVARLAGPYADYVIIHCYSPALGYGEATGEARIPEAEQVQEDQFMKAAMASSEQYEFYLGEYRRMVREESGRDLPLAVSEYNLGYTADLPKPYRYSLGAALKCADLLRILLKPENGVIFANYWEFLNGHFGMIKTNSEGKVINELPAYWVFKLWGTRFGTKLIDAKVKGPTGSYINNGAITRVASTINRPYEARKSLGTQKLAAKMSSLSDLNTVDGIRGKVESDGVLSFEFNDYKGDTNGPLLARIEKSDGLPENTGVDYTVRFEGRFTPSKPGGSVGKLGIVLVDSRGWRETKSAMTLLGVSTSEWKKFSGFFRDTRFDAPGIDIMLKPDSNKESVSGRLDIRNIEIEAFSKERFPDYQLVTASASLSEDGSVLYVIAINKSGDKDLATEIEIGGFNADSARRWEVTGPSLASVEGVKETAGGPPVSIDGSKAETVLKAHSITAFEFRRAE